MNGCRHCGHEQASHRYYFGRCNVRTAFVLACTCEKYEPADPLDRRRDKQASEQ